MLRPLTVTLLFSITAHTALLLSWAVQQPSLAVAPQATAPMELQLSLVTQTIPPPARQIPKQVITTLEAPALATPRVTTATPLPIQTEEISLSTATASTSLSAHILDDTMRSRVLQRVHSDFTHYFYYPLLARRNGWQGHVLLGFAVEADGAITHAHVARGSGYRILDESALAALQQVQSLPQTTHWLNGGRIELKLPVEYRLTGG